MTIISIANRSTPEHEFCFLVCPDDTADHTVAQLTRANHQAVFSIKRFRADGFNDVVNYIRLENDTTVQEPA